MTRDGDGEQASQAASAEAARLGGQDTPPDRATDAPSPEEQAAAAARVARDSRNATPTAVSTAPPPEDSGAPGDDSEDAPDHWLDPVSTETRTRRSVVNAFVQETFGQPFYVARQMWGFLTTSPGKITAMTIIISVAIFAAGYAMSVSSDTRQSHLDQLITNTEPVSYNAHVLYTSLSVADTTATTGFVQAGVEDPENRVKYNTAVDRASVAATETASAADPTDERILELVTEIQRQLPVYTGLVETARTNNRAGNPVSVAYMSEASAMMRNEVLPKAAELYNITSRAVAEQQSSVTRPQWVPLSGLLAALAMLISAQWWLMRITRRRINKGFALATVFMLTATVWVSAANWANWNAGTRGFEEASGPLNSMTTARIYAQQTRTTETLALVRRQQVLGSATGFSATINQINSAIDEYETTAESGTPEHQELILEVRGAVNAWTREHDLVTVALESGDYTTAVNTVLSTDERGETSFDQLDRALSELIADSRVSMRTYIRTGLEATQLVSVMVLFLSITSVLSLWIGIRPRLQEYL